jgi:hypothetical protein
MLKFYSLFIKFNIFIIKNSKRIFIIMKEKLLILAFYINALSLELEESFLFFII